MFVPLLFTHSYVEVIILNIMAFEDGALGRSFEIEEVMSVGTSKRGQCPYKERHQRIQSLSFSLWVHTFQLPEL